MEIKDIKTTDDLIEAIEERAGIGLYDGSVPLGKKFAWFDKKVFELFQPIPLTELPLAVFAMFNDPDEVRVYAIINIKEGFKPTPEIAEQMKTMPPYQRFTLSKHHASVFIDVFPATPEEPLTGQETYVNAIVGELQKLAISEDEGADAIDVLERMREAVAAGKIDEALAILKEDEDEPPKPASPNGATAASPAV